MGGVARAKSPLRIVEGTLRECCYRADRFLEAAARARRMCAVTCVLAVAMGVVCAATAARAAVLGELTLTHAVLAGMALGASGLALAMTVRLRSSFGRRARGIEYRWRRAAEAATRVSAVKSTDSPKHARHLLIIPEVHEHIAGVPGVREFWLALAPWIRRWAKRRRGIMGVKVYLDSYSDGPVGSLALEQMMRDSNTFGRVLRWMVDEGCDVVPTEDEGLIALQGRLVQVGEGDTNFHLASMAVELVTDARDAAIAAIIDRTLGPGETGVLFIGARHDVASRLPKDVGVLYPN